MRFFKFINEETADLDDMNRVANIIKKDCSKFLKETGNIPIYRGMKGLDVGPLKIKSVKERKPLNTPGKIHDLLNRLFNKRFKWSVRNGVFVSGNIKDAKFYGLDYRFFPIGDYDYVWSPVVQDLFGYNEKFGISALDFESLKNIYLYPKTCDTSGWFLHNYVKEYPEASNRELIEMCKNKLVRFYEDLISTYKNNNLQEGIKSGMEISFNCKEYYLVGYHEWKEFINALN